MKTIDACKDRWLDILPMMGIEEHFLNGRHHKCPKDGSGKDRFRFTDQNGTGSYFCACSDGSKGGMGLLKCVTSREFGDLAREIDERIGNEADKPIARQATYAEQLRSSAITTKRSAYLESRGLEMPPGIQWCNAVDYRDDQGSRIGTYGAMLCPVMKKGVWQTYHVTYLHKGKKADVPCPRKILPGPPITGGGIELYPSAKEMGVGEGVETCIAAKMIFDLPTHAAINSTMLAKWEWPDVLETLHIFADNDANFAGHAAAWTLAHRAAKMGKAVHVHIPPTVGHDWNDVLLAAK